MRPDLEIADIFRKGFRSYLDTSPPLTREHFKAAKAIMTCRTEIMGGHKDSCSACGHERTLHNSCGNRHCPQCQGASRMAWVQKRTEELLPVPYFHAVFTVPSELNPILLRNRESLYPILFSAARETLEALAADPKFLGVRSGFCLVLHTWGQNLMDHPHIHCILPSGGLDPKQKSFRIGKGRFLFPAAVMAKLYRGKFLDYFKQEVKQGNVRLTETMVPEAEFQAFIRLLYNKRWVVHIKAPFAGPERVVKYLGQYTHRVAISNHRLLNHCNGKVTFSLKDYRTNKRTRMTLTTVEFIRRFMLHVLPSGFMRIRHYGFLSNAARGRLLPVCKALLEGKSVPEESEPSDEGEESKAKKRKPSWYETVIACTGHDPRLCPVCGLGIMQVVSILPGLVRRKFRKEEAPIQHGP